jgi:hypothetical protein
MSSILRPITSNKVIIVGSHALRAGFKGDRFATPEE